MRERLRGWKAADEAKATGPSRGRSTASLPGIRIPQVEVVLPRRAVARLLPGRADVRLEDRPVSLRAPCRMRFRRMVAGEREVAEVQLAPRSAYVLAGEARWSWQHSIPATKDLRYSVTFRTLRRGSSGG
jgi:hypothetical protein